MAIQTSRVTTTSAGNLQLDPDGAGKVRLNKLAGLGTQPIGVDNNGDTQKFVVSGLAARTPAATDVLMIQQNGGASVTKCTITDILGLGTSGIALTDLSVTKAVATGGGNLVYNNGTGVFTYTPPLQAGKNGVAFDGADFKFQISVNSLSNR